MFSVFYFKSKILLNVVPGPGYAAKSYSNKFTFHSIPLHAILSASSFSYDFNGGRSNYAKKSLFATTCPFERGSYIVFMGNIFPLKSAFDSSFRTVTNFFHDWKRKNRIFRLGVNSSAIKLCIHFLGYGSVNILSINIQSKCFIHL